MMALSLVRVTRHNRRRDCLLVVHTRRLLYYLPPLIIRIDVHLTTEELVGGLAI